MFLGDGRERERREEMGGNRDEKLVLKRIPCASQFTIPDKAGSTPNPVGKNTDMRSSKPYQASHTPDFLYPLVSSIFVPIFIPHLSFSTIITEHKVMLSLSISPCHDNKLTLSTAYTEYGIYPRFSVFLSFSRLVVDA